MAACDLHEKAATYLRELCVDIESRRVGSAGNKAATGLFTRIVESFGFETSTPEFICVDWIDGGAELTVGGKPFEVFTSPYSPGCSVRAPLRVVSTVDELEAEDLSGGNVVLLLRGEIAREQLMPKNFPFYNPDSHKRIIELLEARHPLAIVTATSRDVEMVGGGVYPFPLIEDGDFDIPSVYLTDEEGERLAEYAGKEGEVSLTSRAQRVASRGCNVIARKGSTTNGRVVIFAHIDAKMGTPGAIDNASGVVVLLLLAELLADRGTTLGWPYGGSPGVELVAVNGEDYFSSPGEQQYLALNEGRFDEIVLGINLDGLAYRKGRVAYSLYDCPTHLSNLIRTVFSGCEDLVEGEPWYQGDHGLFLMNARPALAITSELVTELMEEIVHTPRDTPEVVDTGKLVAVACALRDLLVQVGSPSIEC